jgi:hypothetical protein
VEKNLESVTELEPKGSGEICYRLKRRACAAKSSVIFL